MSKRRCGYRISSTKTCSRTAKPGTDRCWQHSNASRGGNARNRRREKGRPTASLPAAPLPTETTRREPNRLLRPVRHGPQGRISDDEEALRWLADRVRVHTSGNSGGITPQQTMKNYHGIAALRRMTQPEALPYGAKAVFAGGTCLALGHRLVERYSEDIDLVILGCSGLDVAQRNEVLDELAALASGHGLLASQVLRRKPSTFLKQEVGYPRTIEPESASRLSIQVDAGFADDLPERDITTVSVETYLSLRGDRNFAAHFDDLLIPEVPAVKPRVTMAEKLIALHQRAVAGQRKALASRARDAIDIGAMAEHEPTLRSLAETGSTIADFDERQAQRAEGVDPDTLSGRRLLVRRPLGGFADSPVWKMGDPMNEALRRGYQGIGHLIYDKTKKPRFEDVVERVHHIRHLL